MSPARGFDPRVDAAPPLEPVLELASRLGRAGIAFALGGSGLLAACGLARTIGGWDLTTDTALARLLAQPLPPDLARALSALPRRPSFK